MEQKNEKFEEIRKQVAPLAQQFLEDETMFERLKMVSPGLSEEYLRQMLEKTAGNEEV